MTAERREVRSVDGRRGWKGITFEALAGYR
jgi:hypothetical protein